MSEEIRREEDYELDEEYDTDSYYQGLVDYVESDNALFYELSRLEGVINESQGSTDVTPG